MTFSVVLQWGMKKNDANFLVILGLKVSGLNKKKDINPWTISK